jgi:hypothetical protein
VKLVWKNHGVAWKGHEIDSTLKISVKSGKDSTSTLSLVIHRVIKKKPAKKYISIQGGGETQKTIKISGDFAAISKFHSCMEPPKFFIIFNTPRMLQIVVAI